MLDRIQAEANTKAALMKRPEWTIRTSDILDGDEGEDVDFTLTEEEREDIRRDVERITDKRAALLSKENGKEYADYTLTRDRMGRVEVQDFSVSLGDGWNWREEMDNEILRRANALSGDTQSFSALAGIDTALRQAARKIEVRLPTLDEAHKATALRARMEGNTDGRFTLRILDDAALWEDCTREAAARVGVLFPVPEGGEGPEVFLSEEDAALLEDAIGAYVLACGLARFYGSRSLDAGQKEEAARAADLENVLRSFARNQAGGSYARLKERWKEEAVAQAVAVLSPFSARLGQDGTLSLSLRLESGDAAQACALVRTAILAKVMERFYSALLRGEEAGTYATKAQAALEAATAVFRRQRTYPDGGFFDSLLTVATGDADLLFARLKSRKTRPMYRSAVTLRVLSLFYAQLGLPDLAAAYEGDMRARAELARSLAAEFSAAYTVVQGRLADGLRQLPDLLAPLQRALPLPPVEDGGDEAVLRLMQQRARLSYSSTSPSPDGWSSAGTRPRRKGGSTRKSPKPCAAPWPGARTTPDCSCRRWKTPRATSTPCSSPTTTPGRKRADSSSTSNACASPMPSHRLTPGRRPWRTHWPPAWSTPCSPTGTSASATPWPRARPPLPAPAASTPWPSPARRARALTTPYPDILTRPWHKKPSAYPSPPSRATCPTASSPTAAWPTSTASASKTAPCAPYPPTSKPSPST